MRIVQKKLKKQRSMPPSPRSPSPGEVAHGRESANLTAVSAASIICVTGRAWSHYEAGRSEMNGALWRYFCIVTNQFDLM
jgi:DNA-binding transcriptional regulator YiaG